MTNIELYQQRIQRKINPGDKRFNVNTLNFNIENRRLFFHESYCYDKKYDFILLKDNTLKIGLQHQHLSKNIMDQVIGAGSLKINREGLVIHLDNQSGTFQFSKSQQDEYIHTINTIIKLDNAKIYDIDYSVRYDPVNPKYMEQPNPFYYPIQYLDDKYKQHIKPINKDQFDWILDINEFNTEIYYDNNSDIQKRIVKDDYVLLLFHFITRGQYEMGRCVGFY
jgi:hypothetical protein